MFPYKWFVIQNVVFNILGAFFALFSFAMVVPFLRVLFGNKPADITPMDFELSTEYIMNQIYLYMDQIIQQHGDAGALVMVSILVVVFSLLKNGFLFGANYVLAPLRAFIVRDIRNEIYDKVLKLPLSYYTEARKGDVIARISSDVQEIETSIMSSLAMLFRDPLTIVIYMVFLFSISANLTLFVLLVLPIAGYLIGRVARSLRKTTFRGQKRLGELLALLEETLTGLRIIKAFNGEKQMSDKFYSTNDKFARIFRKIVRKRYLATPFSEFTGTIVLMVIMAYGGSLVLSGSGKMSGENLILFLIIFSQVIPPAKNFTTAWFSIQKGMASVDRVDQLLDADDKIFEKPDAMRAEGFKESIEFRNVTFRYDKEDVLKDVSFTIKKGQTIALVGKSGAGKSTLVDLMPRFIDVSGGTVLIDGIPVQDYQIKSLRKLMGIVSQQSILFNDTFRNNIVFGMNGDVEEEKVIHAARVANAHGFIMETQNGYEENVGEGGGKLSGGQKQRVSIARAVMADPPILILDEATSALDTESEQLVQDAIMNLVKNRTSIVIAHRLSTIKHADQILVIDDGRIVERGTHKELIKNSEGIYHKLHSMQMF